MSQTPPDPAPQPDPAPTPGEITQLLRSSREGDAEAYDSLMPLVYAELRRLAAHFMQGERRDHTLQPTALVNEAYLKLAGLDRVDWQDRAHFFTVAATAMRRILVSHGRSVRRKKRGGDWQRTPLDEAHRIDVPLDPTDLVALDEALEKLAQQGERRAKVVELRYFAGLSIEETAEVLGLSPATVKQDWTLAKAWLLREMSRPE